MNLYLNNDLLKYFSKASSLFDQIMELRGECFRHQKGRLTQRIFLGGKSYFIKQHAGIGWREIFKNLLQGRWPVISAKNEWRAIEKLKAAGILTPNVVGYGQRGINPAKMQSFILMEELTPTNSLEDLCRAWQESPPLFAFKKKLIIEVARITRVMHRIGMNHRDFYICHFLLDKTLVNKTALYLIDLHRAQIRKQVPKRWIIKDLSGLYFSSKNNGLTRRDLWRFMREYTEKPLRDIFKKEKKYWQTIKRRGERLYCDHNQ